MTAQSLKRSTSLGQKLWLMLALPANRYGDGEYYTRRIGRTILNRQLLGLVLGSLIGLFLGIVYIAGILPASGAIYAAIMVVSYVWLHHELFRVPALPQRLFRENMACALAYTLTCGLLVSIGRDYGWVLGSGLIFVYCFALPFIRAIGHVRSYVKSHDTI